MRLPPKNCHIIPRNHFFRQLLSGLPPAWFWFALLCSIASPAVEACPIFLGGQELKALHGAAPRHAWRAFRVVGSAGKHAWAPVGMQVDPLDKDEHVEFFAPDHAWAEASLAVFDRIVVAADAYGARMARSDALPCATTTKMLEVRDPDAERYFYIAACITPPGSDQLRGPDIVTHDTKNRVVSSKVFEYHYQAGNQLMFDKIIVRAGDGTPHQVSGVSDQRVHLLIRNFFDLNLDSADIRSTIESTRTTPLGMLAKVAFYLKILFLKIDLKLSTGVSFFEDGVHVPMVLNMPVNVSEHAYPKSGIIFSWENPPDARWDEMTGMPQLDVSLLGDDKAKLVEHGLKYCRQDKCHFSMRGQIADRRFAQIFVIPRHLVDLGFFPMAVLSVNQAQKDLGWESKDVASPSRMGVYFEVSRLPKGDHAWDMAVRVSDRGTDPSQCPLRAQVVGLVK